MEAGALIDILQQMLFIVIAIVAIIITPGLITGLLIAIFQAATQINEITLSFLPKLFITLLVITLLSPWLFNMLAHFTEQLVMDIPAIIG